MHRWFIKIHTWLFSWRHIWTEEVLALGLVLFVFAVPVTNAMRLQDRSLYIANNNPGEISAYTVSFRYMSPTPVGSIDMKFCIDPIPYHPCVPPAGLNVSNAALSDQQGETGFSIQQQTSNRIVLSRPSPGINAVGSSYKFVNIRNPTVTNQPFSIRLTIVVGSATNTRRISLLRL